MLCRLWAVIFHTPPPAARVCQGCPHSLGLFLCHLFCGVSLFTFSVAVVVVIVVVTKLLWREHFLLPFAHRVGWLNAKRYVSRGKG